MKPNPPLAIRRRVLFNPVVLNQKMHKYSAVFPASP